MATEIRWYTGELQTMSKMPESNERGGSQESTLHQSEWEDGGDEFILKKIEVELILDGYKELISDDEDWKPCCSRRVFSPCSGKIVFIINSGEKTYLPWCEGHLNRVVNEYWKVYKP